MSTEQIKCWFCGVETVLGSYSSGTSGRLERPPLHRVRTREHLTPTSRGGVDCAPNVVTACFSCNSQKGDKTLEEYRGYLFGLTPGGRARHHLCSALATGAIDREEDRSAILSAIADIDVRLSKVVFWGEVIA